MLKTSDTRSIVVDDVHKHFRLRHTHSFKETFLAALKRRSISSDFRALDGVSFTVEQGESVALLGFNGSGKSTTLKMISGVLAPDRGEVLTKGRVAGLIEVGAGFHPDLSGRENIFLNAAILGMSRREIESRFDEIVAFSEISQFIDTEVKHYSSGMFLRLAFAVAIHTELDVLLIDEILSVGDEPFQRKCLARIRELHAAGKTLVVVSHDLNMVARLCARGIVLQEGKVVFDGPSGEAVSALRELSRSPFVDIATDHPYFDDIVRLTDAQILPTSSDASGARIFDPGAAVTVKDFADTMRMMLSLDVDVEEIAPPNAVLTRAALAEAVYALHTGPPVETALSPFADVEREHRSFSAIAWLYETGISKGWHSDLGQPLFRPHETVAREALVLFLGRLRELHRSSD